MRKATFLAIVGLAFGLATVSQAEEIPGNVLAKMGLGGMKRMTDAHGMRVRGEGLASVFGGGASIVVLPGFAAHTANHSASSSVPSALAVGDSSTGARSAIGLEINVAGIAATLSLFNEATSAGNGFAFAR